MPKLRVFAAGSHDSIPDPGDHWKSIQGGKPAGQQTIRRDLALEESELAAAGGSTSCLP